MKTIKVNRTEAKILDAIKEVKGKGVQIKEGGWFIEWNSKLRRWVPEAQGGVSCSCPLGALLLVTQPKPNEDQLEWLQDQPNDTETLADLAAQTLGKPREWVDNFIGNFDGEYEGGYEGEGCDSGLKLRKILVK